MLRCLSPVGTNLPIRNVRYMAAGIAAACSAACQIEFRLIHIYRDDEMALGMGVEIDHNAQCNKIEARRSLPTQGRHEV